MKKNNDTSFIPLCVPEIRGNAWAYLKECLDTNWVSSAGSYVERFEETVGKYVGRKYAVACTSGTAALHISLLLAGINSDEEVIVPALTFAASANVARYAGAWPVFMDVTPDTWQIDAQKLSDFIEKECACSQGPLVNRHTGRKVRAIMPVHLLGHPVDMDPLLDIAKKYNLIVIEDAAQSLGAIYKGKQTGSLGDMACFSFNGNKIITSGGGGMIVTDNKEWAQRAKYLTTQAKQGPDEFIHEEIGYNYRLSNIHAALGVAQMEFLDEYVSKKQRIARNYHEALGKIEGITLPVEAEWAQATFWLYTILINEKIFGKANTEVMSLLKEQKINTRLLWYPLHKQKPFKNCFAYHIEVADQLYRSGLSLPSSAGLTWEDQQRVMGALRDMKQ